MKKILVVVDMQNDFIDGPLGTPEARAIVDKVCEKIRSEEWEYIYYTHDTHYETYLETQEGKKLPVKHCINNTTGWKTNSKVLEAMKSTESSYERIDKYTFGSWSLPCTIEWLMDCFYDLDESDFEITLVGVCTDICVISNALIFKAHFPETKIVVDAACCAGSTVGKHFEALDVMKSCQIDILNDPTEMTLEEVERIVEEMNKLPRL